MKVGIVFGTYNRLGLLQRAVWSVRRALRYGTDYKMFIVDGGSTDGTRDFLAKQAHGCEDILPIYQSGPLTGAVTAFNLGFAAALDAGAEWVVHLNDDAEIVTVDAISQAIDLMTADGKIGEVAFELDLRGSWGFEHVNGVPYANFGVIRRQAGVDVANAQGDETGRAWWDPSYRTYGADTQFGVWLWKLGWRVHEGTGLRVHDANAMDELRRRNQQAPDAHKKSDSDLFWSRWRDESLPPPQDERPKDPAEREHGVGTGFHSQGGYPGETHRR